MSAATMPTDVAKDIAYGGGDPNEHEWHPNVVCPRCERPGMLRRSGSRGGCAWSCRWFWGNGKRCWCCAQLMPDAEVALFAERIVAYMTTRDAPWADEGLMREAATMAVRLVIGDAHEDARDVMKVLHGR